MRLLTRRLRRALVAVAALGLAGSFGVAVSSPAQAAGTGPYSAGWETQWTLPNHTIFRPNQLPAGVKLPIVAWGNGGCLARGTWFQQALNEWASHGFLVIANGAPNGSGQTNARQLTESIDWAIRQNTNRSSKYYGRIDTEKVAVMGQSCGGLEALQVRSQDARVDTTVLWNSGLLNDANNAQLTRLRAPIAFFTGGQSDIAYPNAVDDYRRIGQALPQLPALLGHLGNVGHYGTWRDANAGEMGRVGTSWLQWHLKGDAAAAQRFVGPDCGLCSGTQWRIEKRNI